MNQKTIIKNNILIAEFMGWEVHTKGMYDFPEGFKDELVQYYDCILPKLMKFHTSWDWLMPVVEKCMKTGNNTNQWDWLFEALSTININDVYKAVVEFIKWYNKKGGKK